jgi:diguanylate cyclase (GGDEF)-like protein
MDLDNFKDINDTYGHHVGDRALRDVAMVLRAAIRPYDICVRYAGDEFIVVLSGCGGEEAEGKRLELQRAVDNLAFEAKPGKMLPLAISIGASIFPHDGDSYETLLATADSRMYRDKTRRKRHTPEHGPQGTPGSQNSQGSRKPSDDQTPRSASPATTSSTSSLSDVDLQRSAIGIL